MEWDEGGNPLISSAAFKDEELSVYIETPMARDGREPAQAIREYAGYGLAAITAGHARSLSQAAAGDPLPDERPTVLYSAQRRRAVLEANSGTALLGSSLPQPP